MPSIDPRAIIVPARQRSRINPEKLKELEGSIAEHGQLQPIILRETDAGLTLVIGGTRLAACRNLGREVRYELISNLSPRDAAEVELEENIKRDDLSWRDYATAIGTIHERRRTRDAAWTMADTARRLSLTQEWISTTLTIFRNLANPALNEATGITNAYGILQRIAERKTASIVGEIINQSTRAFNPTPAETSANGQPPSSTTASPLPNGTADTPPGGAGAETKDRGQAQDRPPILVADFIEWAPEYVGPKFNLIHVDFPYGVDYTAFAKSVNQRGADMYEADEDLYFRLLNAFCGNLDNFCSYSAHILFWFHMNHYEQTKRTLSAAGLFVHNRPLVWVKSDNSGIVPGTDAQYPRWTYETAFLASRGRRPLLKAFADHYACPIVSNPIHPTMKPEPVLLHFFSGLVDEHTDLLDPTVGSGSAIRAAERSGARSVLGLEINSDFAEAANGATIQARAKALASGAYA